MQQLPAEYRAEPALALDGGDDGMDFIRPLLSTTPAHLTDTACWCSRSATSAGTSRRSLPAPASRRPGWSTSAGDDAVLLLTREDLLITLREASRCGAAPRSCCSCAGVTLQPGEKIGLIGRNGAGKSSLFSLLTGRLHADAGDVEMPPRWRIGEVAQDMPDTEDGATEFVLQGDTVAAAQAALAAAEASGDGHAIADAHQALDEAGAFDARRVRRRCCWAWASESNSSTRRSTASPAAGACGCSWPGR
jgi:hypothetical protein